MFQLPDPEKIAPAMVVVTMAVVALAAETETITEEVAAATAF
jgi:hypothetical protein